MEFINNCKFDDITQTLLSSGSLSDVLGYLKDLYTKQYEDFLDKLSLLGGDTQIDPSIGIATVKGLLLFRKLKESLDNGDSTVPVYDDDGVAQNIDVNEATQLLVTAKEDAAAVATSFAALQDSVQNGREMTEDIIGRFWNQLTGSYQSIGNGIKSAVDNLILSTTTTIFDKIKGILGLITPDQTPTSIEDELMIDGYSFGSPWAAWTSSINWDLSSVYTVFRDWFVFNFTAMINISTAIVEGVFKAFKSVVMWLGNKLVRLIAGNNYTRIISTNSLPDTGGFPIVFTGEALSSSYLSYLNDLFHNQHGAIQINVPGGLILWYDYNTSGGFYKYSFRFIPENQANLFPSDEYDMVDGVPRRSWNWDDSFTQSRMYTANLTTVLDWCQDQSEGIGLINPYKKDEPTFLDMDKQVDINQFVSSYRSSFFLLANFLAQSRDNTGAVDNSVCQPDIYDDYEDFLDEFFPSNKSHILGAWSVDKNLATITGSTTIAYPALQSQGGNSKAPNAKRGLQVLFENAAMKYCEPFLWDVYYTWPIQQVVYAAPSFGVHVTTDDEFNRQVEHIFTNAKRAFIISTITIISIVALKKIRMSALRASTQAELMIFSQGWTGSDEQIKALMKVRRKASVLSFFGGAFVASALSSDSSSVFNNNSEIIQLIRGN